MQPSFANDFPRLTQSSNTMVSSIPKPVMSKADASLRRFSSARNRSELNYVNVPSLSHWMRAMIASKGLSSMIDIVLRQTQSLSRLALGLHTCCRSQENFFARPVIRFFI